MKMHWLICFVAFLLFVSKPAICQESQSDGKQDPKVESKKDEKPLFDAVVEQMEKRYFDKEFRTNELPKIVERYRPLAEKAETLAEQRAVTFKFLSHFPATHLGLLSEASYKQVMGELFGRKAPCFGMELIEINDQYFAHTILEGGPAAKAGIKMGDRIVRIDKQPVRNHKRLDYRTDDSFLPDPPVHGLICKENDVVEFEVDKGWGKIKNVSITATLYSSFEAAKASARVIEKDGMKVGYIHFWFIHINGVQKLIQEKLENEFKDCDAFIIDLRGRGGNGGACRGIANTVGGKTDSWSKPSVALIDRNTRSAKEVISLYFKREKSATLVGEKTAGAVIPATFKKVGHDTVLMFPTFTLGKLTTALEGIGVEPDVAVEKWRPGIDHHDPIYKKGVEVAFAVAKKNLAKAKAKSENSKSADGESTESESSDDGLRNE